MATGGNSAGAVTFLRDYTLRQPDDFQGLYWLGHAYRDLNEFLEAREAFERAARIRPFNYAVHYELGLVLERLGFFQQAREHLEFAVRCDPQKSQAHFELSKLLRRLEGTREADPEFQEFLKLEAKDRAKKTADALHARATAAVFPCLAVFNDQ